MDGQLRRQRILDLLRETSGCHTGQELAQRFGVSRQIIVSDIALLRASGESILATPQGYMMYPASCRPTRTIACRHHTLAELLRELLLVVDNGGRILDVAVEHPVYGELRGTLMLSSRRDVEEFVSRLESSGAKPLAALTDGVHLHTIEADSQEDLDFVVSELQEAGFLLLEDQAS